MSGTPLVWEDTLGVLGGLNSQVYKHNIWDSKKAACINEGVLISGRPD